MKRFLEIIENNAFNIIAGILLGLPLVLMSVVVSLGLIRVIISIFNGM